jgi:hypothetical protein
LLGLQTVAHHAVADAQRPAVVNVASASQLRTSLPFVIERHWYARTARRSH